MRGFNDDVDHKVASPTGPVGGHSQELSGNTDRLNNHSAAF